jgi:hypothetical protein
MLDDEDLQVLAADIKRNGLNLPIVLDATSNPTDPADAQVHGVPTRPSIFEEPNWAEEVAEWKRQERELELQRQRQLAQHPAHCICHHCELPRANRS